KRDFALVQMSEVDTGRENAAAWILVMLDAAAAQDRDFSRLGQDRKISCYFKWGQCGFVMCVEGFGISQLDNGSLACGAYDRGVEINRPLFQQSREQLARLGPRQQHGVTQVSSALRP